MTPNVKKLLEVIIAFLIASVITVILMLILIARSSPAHADSNSFISDLENSQIADFYGPKSQFIVLGYRVCTDWDNGFSLGTITNNVYWNNSFDRIAAGVLVTAAITNLCGGSNV